MAQPIHCDGPGDQHPADVLISMLANGETLAWCFPHYADACRAIAAEVDAVAAELEAEATDAAALARLDAADAPAHELDPDDDGDHSAFTHADDFVDPVAVVPKGRSKSRAAHESRQRARQAEVAQPPADEADGAQGPESGAVGDPDEVADPV